jgi:hypothetical protein
VLFVLAAPIVILVMVLAVPIAYRYLWPVTVKRPGLFLAITLATGLVIAAVSIAWVFSVLVSGGITGASAGAAASQAAFETVMRNRLMVAAVFAVVIEYLLCRITQTIMGL